MSEQPVLPNLNEASLPQARNEASVPAPFDLSSSPGDGEREIDLRAIWWTLVKRKWTIILVFLVTVIGTLTATFLMTPIYRATTMLQIDRESPKMVNFEDMESASEGRMSDQYFYQTQYELLKSRTLAERVIDHLHLENQKPFKNQDDVRGQDDSPGWWTGLFALAKNENEAVPGEDKVKTARDARNGLVQQFLSRLTVSPVRNSKLVQLHFDTPDPDLAARIANAIAELFIQISLERRFDAASHATNFLQQRLAQVKAKLEDGEWELVAYAGKEGIINVGDKQSMAMQKLSEFNKALAEAERDRIAAESLHTEAALVSGHGVGKILESKVIGTLKEERAKLEADYQDKLQLYKPEYPQMLQQRRQIDELDRQIQSEVAAIRTSIQTDYTTSSRKESMLRSQIETLKREFMELQNRSVQYQILQRDVDTSRTLYEGILQRLKEIGVVAGATLNNIAIVEQAKVPSLPYKPSKRINLLVGMALGLFAGIGLAFLFEYLDDTVKLPEDVERVANLSMLGIIPQWTPKRGASREFSLPFLTSQDARSAFAESIRSLRTALLFSTSTGAPRVLHFTSVAQGEGKSTLLINLAITFTQLGNKVLLIDADLRRPSLHRMFGLDAGRGLCHYLAGGARPVDVAQATGIDNLFAIPAGVLPPNPSELLSSARMLDLIKLGSEKFDYVLIDSPPVLGLADALVLAGYAQGTVIVAAAGGTRRAHLMGAIKRLSMSQAKIVGGVLNKVGEREGARSYYYYHYHYGHYGEESSGKQLTV